MFHDTGISSSLKPAACRATELNWTELNRTERSSSVQLRDMRGPATELNGTEFTPKSRVLDSCDLLRPSSWKRPTKLGHDVTIHETSSTRHTCRLTVDYNDSIYSDLINFNFLFLFMSMKKCTLFIFPNIHFFLNILLYFWLIVYYFKVVSYP